MCGCAANFKKFNKCNHFFNLVKYALVLTLFIVSFAIFSTNHKNINFIVSGEGLEDEFGESLKNESDKILNELDFSELEELFFKNENASDLLNGNSVKEYISLIINGEETVSIDKFFDVVLRNAKVGVKKILAPLSMILVVVLLFNLFNIFKANRISGVSELVYFICFSVIILLLSKNLAEIVNIVKDSIGDISSQMGLLFPVLLSMLTAMGGISSVKAYSPVLLILSNIITKVFMSILLPLFTVSLILSIVGNLSENVKLSKVNGFIKSLYKWIIGVVFAVFIGFLSIKGLTAGVSDGLSVKATKYAIKNYIPMLGGYISQGFEFVKAGSMLIKNATGFFGILLLFFNIVSPVLMVAAFQLGLKMLSGVIEVVGDKRASNLLFDIAASLRLLVVVLIGVALMYFVTIFLLICSAANFV